MSFKGSLDEDRENKLLLFNFFYNLGFSVRLEIPLCEYFKGEKLGGELTDLDIYGLKFIPFIGFIKITASAKGKAKNVSHSSEIFKLKGVNNYFKPIKSYYIHNESPTDELYFFSKKMDIEVLSKDSLSTMIERIEKKFVLSNKGAESINKALEITKKYGFYDYITSEFWISDKADKIYKIEGLIKKLYFDFKKAEDNNILLLIFYLISLFIISLLEVMESIQNSPSKDFEYRLKITLHGGKDIFRNSIELIDGFKEYLKHLNVSPNKFNYDIVIPNFAKYLELFTRSFLNIEGLDLALHIIDSLLFYFAESDIFLDINQEIKKYTSNNKLIENALSFLRYLFRFLSFQTSSDINIIAKKINLYES